MKALLAGMVLMSAVASAGGDLADVRRLIDAGKFTEAEDRCRSLREEIVRREGEGSATEARLLDLLVETFWRGGKGSDAAVLELALRAVELKERHFGSEDAEVAVSLRNLGRIRDIRGQAPESVALYERAIAIFAKTRGTSDTEVGVTHSFLGNLQKGMGHYASARSHYESAMAIYQKAGLEKYVASTTHNLGLLCHDMGEFGAAREFYDRALALNIRLFGDEHPSVAVTLNGMATLAEEIGEFAEARSYYERALAIRQKAFGPKHILVAGSLHNLGALLLASGNYVQAGRTLDEALAIKRELVGVETESTAMTIYIKAQLAQATGDYASAGQQFNEALRIREKILNADDPVLAGTFLRIAAFHAARERYLEAEALYRRALEIIGRRPPSESAASDENRTRALILDGLGWALAQTGRQAEALSDFNQTLALREKAYGPEHPLVAASLEGLGTTQLRSGQLVPSEASLRRALAIRRKGLGDSHPLTARAWRALGSTLLRRGDRAGALDAALAAERIGRQHLRLTSRALADRQALLYAGVRTTGLDLALDVVSRADDAAANRRVWESLVRSRAVVLDEMAARHRSLAIPSGETETSELFTRYAAASRRLANLHVRGPEGSDPDRHYRLMAQALKEKERLEQDLAARSAVFREAQAGEEASLDAVVRALPAGSALVACARYEPDPDDRGQAPMPGYLAFVARAGDTRVRVVSLGDAATLDALVARWTASVTRVDPAARPGEDPSRPAGEDLRRALWDRIDPHLKGVERVFFVPDGALNLVNIAALPAGSTGYFVESGPLLHYLSAERELLREPKPPIAGVGLLALGGASFDDASATQSAGGQSRFRGAHASCGFFDSITFPPLPGSLREVREIADLWSRGQGARGTEATGPPVVIRLTERDAGEEALKAQAPGRRVVHLATHGFYLDGTCNSAAAGSRGADEGAVERGIGGVAPSTAISDDAPIPSGPSGARDDDRADNPLTLSGLALAGANRRRTAPPDQEDGILTAEEIGALDLRSVEWAVLSGCHTGVGQVRTGEGVLGLRRAFQIAGARTLIMSLWPVEDEATRHWMVSLYEARFTDGRGTAEAVRRASIALLGKLREGRRSTSPLLWGAFVASGDWR